MRTHTVVSEPGVRLAPPGTFAAEQYQNLRLKIERLQQARGVRVIAVTSPATNDGKTLTSINLAAALTRGPATRVLLIDADLRRPSVASQLALSGEEGPGLAAALGDGETRLPDVARPVDGVDGLTVVPAGVASSHVHELLRSPRFEQLLQEARGAYDFVVLDTPPLVPVCDAAVMSRFVDGMLVVVAAHETTRKQLGEALSLLDEAKTLGLVFNGDARPRASKYDAYYRNQR
jgi:capsular exopolysaccharide synthesis family protein